MYSIVTDTPGLIKTAGPIEPTTDSAFTVTRIPQGAGAVIRFESDCGRQLACVPGPLELRANFARFVMSGY
jgi:hypothetical protein